MLPDAGTILGAVGVVASIFATVMLFVGTRGKTRSDARTAMDARLDQKMAAYTEKLEERLDEAEAKIDEHEQTIETLRTHAKRSNRREKLMLQYTQDLRNHIINRFPPPPPAPPTELSDLFEERPDEDTETL